MAASVFYLVNTTAYYVKDQLVSIRIQLETQLASTNSLSNYRGRRLSRVKDLQQRQTSTRGKHPGFVYAIITFSGRIIGLLSVLWLHFN